MEVSIMEKKAYRPNISGIHLLFRVPGIHHEENKPQEIRHTYGRGRSDWTIENLWLDLASKPNGKGEFISSVKPQHLPNSSGSEYQIVASEWTRDLQDGIFSHVVFCSTKGEKLRPLYTDKKNRTVNFLVHQNQKVLCIVARNNGNFSVGKIWINKGKDGIGRFYLTNCLSLDEFDPIRTAFNQGARNGALIKAIRESLTEKQPGWCRRSASLL